MRKDLLSMAFETRTHGFTEELDEEREEQSPIWLLSSWRDQVVISDLQKDWVESVLVGGEWIRGPILEVSRWRWLVDV